MGDDTGLAGARAGKDEQGALRGLDGSALLGIEMGEKGVQGVESGGKVPESSVSFGRRAVSEAKFGRQRDQACRDLEYDRNAAAGRSPARKSGHRNYMKKRKYGQCLERSLPEVLNIGDQSPSEGHRWGSECCNPRCIYHLETA
jgi:hypothetical protein